MITKEANFEGPKKDRDFRRRRLLPRRHSMNQKVAEFHGSVKVESVWSMALFVAALMAIAQRL